MKGRPYTILFCFIFATIFINCKGCEIEGVDNWLIAVSRSINDTFRGDILDLSTTNIAAINSITYAEGLNSGPYLDISYTNSRFVISTNTAFEGYEEVETSEVIAVTVNFRCTDGIPAFRPFVFRINVVDTNNNAPQFIPSDLFVFTLAPPLPPGFLITGCFNDITVRDIDLTTQRIEFEIEENPYFEIAYDETAQTSVKEFKAILRTKAFIRNIPDSLTYRITATDVDLTNDPPLSTTATVTIDGDTDFEFPEELVFTQAYYLANYSEDDRLVLTESIALVQGYHDSVNFTLHGEYNSSFELIKDGNQLSLRVVTSLQAESLIGQQILLVIRADREYTSGSTATIILQFPERIDLEFERIHYEGQIEDNSFRLPLLVLTKGYENRSVSAVILGDHSTYFTAVVQDNTIAITTAGLPEDVIEENSFIYLEIVASNDYSTAFAIVTLEIIKNDNVTPVFNKPIYEGAYSPNFGLDLEQIVIVQGYDESISLKVEGDYASFFQVIQNETTINLTASDIPPKIFSEQHIILSLEATKPRTVGANAAVIISLPAARQLDFEKTSYKGTLQDNVLNLEEIVLEIGYEESVEFFLFGDHATYFAVSNDRNVVSINLTAPIPANIILENNNIVLTLSASGPNAVTSTSSVILDVIKDDSTTPVFARNIYVGSYASSLVIEDIHLIQGFDDSVTFRLDGDHSEYFQLSDSAGSVVLSLRSAIPENIIFEQKVLLFNILAEKPLTVGANAAILIKFPSELTESTVLSFTQSTYTGTLENNTLNTDIIVLEGQYDSSTKFVLNGEYSSYFTLANTENLITISSLSPLPNEVIALNAFLILEIEASRERAIPVWTSVVIEIVNQETISPKFAEAYYRGVYGAAGLQFEDEISLLFGYDETVQFGLLGDFANYFLLTQEDNSLNLTNISPLPETVLENNRHLIFTVEAQKPNTLPDHTAIFLDIDTGINDAVMLRFEQPSYLGSLQNNELQLPTIALVNDIQSVELSITGDYASFFTITRENSDIIIQLNADLPPQTLEENTLITLELEASYPNVVSGFTTIIIEIPKEPIDVPIFEKAYYLGEYSKDTGLLFENTISLSQGFNQYVSFTLDGEDGQWFTIIENEENNITLRVNSTGIETFNKSHLVFSIVASKSETLAGSAAIVISLTDVFTDNPIRFSQNYYLGSIEDSYLVVETMSLEGYTDDVAVSITGDNANYFQLTNQNGVFTLQLLRELPNDVIRDNNVLIIILEAQRQNTRTHATIILEIIKPSEEINPVILQFEEAYYIGSYNTATDFVFDSPIILSEGYDSDVQFVLQGANSQWFSLIQNQNSVSLTLSSAIPDAVLEVNHKLIFTVAAVREGSITANAVIIIALTENLTDQTATLGFDRINYIGSLENNVATLQPISLVADNLENVTLNLIGELSSYFTITVDGPDVSVSLETVIPDSLLPTNRIILLEIQASSPQTNSAYATIVFEVVIEEDVPSSVHLRFDEIYYTGSYNPEDGLLFNTPIILAEGYDSEVQFSLDGANSQWFSLIQNQNAVSLTLSSAIPDPVLEVNHKLIFTVAAVREGSITANAVIIIALTENLTDQTATLGFDRINYIGSLENNVATLQPISLVGDNLENVTLNLIGELSSYFTITVDGPDVSVSLETVIPDSLLPTNRIILLEIQASSPQTNSAYATIVFEVVIEEDVPSSVHLRFDEIYYTGSYNPEDGLLFNTPIILAEGYDSEVQFSLDGANSQWFSLIQNQNAVSLTLSSAIPDAVLEINHKLVFTIAAVREGSITANAVIIIALTENLTDQPAILGFDRINYIGSLENNVATLQPISLVGDNLENVTLNLIGELSSYFTITVDGPDVSVSLETVIPDSLLPTNRIILLEIQASSPQTNSAYATIVFEVVIEEDVPSSVHLRFDEIYYTGSYNPEDGLLFNTPIILAEGYDSEVQFSLDGANSQWFSLIQNQNAVSLTLSSAIPDAVLEINHKLVFTVAAVREGSITANAVIIIALTENLTDQTATLGFDRINYIGSLENNVATLQPISLVGDNLENVTLNLIGELSSYFTITVDGPDVSVSLETVIPDSLLPTNRIILLEIQASSPQTNSAYATIVFEVVIEEDVPSSVHLRFDEIYYTGSYNPEDGLLFNTPIILAEGYDSEVQFSLDGANSQWFSLIQNQNAVSLTLSSAIPDAVLEINHKLVFTIAAVREGSITANAVIIIALTENLTDQPAILGFDRINYIGSLENNVATLQPISLVGDNLENVTLNLIGELSSYFTITVDGPDVSVSLETVIPDSLLPTNRIILLEIQASSPQTNSAYATIVFEVVIEEDVPSSVHLRFDEIYYTGSYNPEDGLLFNTPIILAEGYDSEVQFSLDGANSQWFSLIQNQNAVSLTLSSAIPDAVLEINHKLVFTVAAVREGSITANAVIIIALTENLTDQTATLGFDRINYIGSLENNVATLQPISLVGDNLENVTLNLIGELSSYFTITVDGPDVSVSLETVIPDSLLPTNRIILLEIQASSPQTNSAYATIVFEVVIEEDVPSSVHLRFDEIYYTGSYNPEDGLLFNTPIILAEGYDSEVQFSLDGANSQWFSLIQNQNAVSLTLSSAIPDAVLEINHKLVFTIAAVREGSITANAVIIIALTENLTDQPAILGFDRINYIGSLENNVATLQPISLVGDNLENVTLNLIGELSSYFTITVDGPDVSVSLETVIPDSLLPTNRIILLEIQASSPQTNSAYATIVFEVVIEEDVPSSVHLRFDEIYYTGSYNPEDGLLFNTPIILAEGYDSEVQFSLDGANSQWFSLIQNQNAVSLTLSSAIPDAVLEINHKLVFTVAAVREGSITANAVIIIALTENLTDQTATLGFDRINYIGSLENNVATLQPISLVGDNLENVTLNLIGELSSYFTITVDGPDVSVSLETVIPDSLLPTNRIILLEIQASSPQTNSAYATIVFEVVIEEDVPSSVHLRFDEIYYTGSYNPEDGLLFNTPIILAEGYDSEVQFSLDGANSQWFSLIQNQNAVSLTLSSAMPDAVLEVNHKLIFTVAAVREGSITANAVIIIALTENLTDQTATIGFDRINYIGCLENNVATLQPISLVGDNLENVTLNLIGELSSYFTITGVGPDVSVSLETVIPDSLLPTNRIILLEIQASSPQTNSAYATIVFEVVIEEDVPSSVHLRFDEIYYIGSYNSEDGLLFNTPITLAEGYDGEVQFSLEGENSQWFSLVQDLNSLSMTLLTEIPSTVLENNRKLVFTIKAQRSESNSAWATIIIAITDATIGPDVSFEKVLYEGVTQFDEVQHEVIRILGYSGTDVEIHGEYSSLFTANVVNGLVTVQAFGSLNLLSDVATVVLELHISGARSVLLLNVLHSDILIQPSVSFSSPTYIVSVDITQTGLVGQVHATADNGEGINYSLLIDSDHLQSRVSINNEGEIYLSAPVNSGVYIFKAIATTVISQATANATIHLTVEAITVCGADEFVMPPLIILDRDEEEPHRNLITLNSTNYPDCQFLLTNRWPVDQTWLYVDRDGLHATAIDREHESIAFMALSQIKVELVLSCEGDNSIRTKRSDGSDWLGDYDYGNNKWVLAETIPFNSRRSVVNLIVNDINDNAPIFIGKGDEPIAVGYPNYDLEDAVLPRSLAELQATDADIGENAAILYWSLESALAVAPATGFVHVRSGARLYDNQRLEVHATDRNGQGLTGSIQLLVKLLDNSHIAVVTVKDAFLDDEGTILAGLRDAIGYDVRALRSAVVSDDINEEDVSRKKREPDTSRASLRLYVYGLIEKEPVGVDRLKQDIINNAITTINVVSTISLEDHLEGCEICVIPGRDTGLLVATIVLSVLLFIIISLIAIWLFLRWRRNKNYDQFSDNNSLASRNDSSGQHPKPESFPKPRLNIQDLKKSERRLQDMLNTPMEDISVEPSTSRKIPEVPIESILDLPLPESQGPIVIQSIDKLKDAGDDSDDEFGEVNGTRRKSVVTFNENVEKIIHVEDDPEETDSESPGYEIYKL